MEGIVLFWSLGKRSLYVYIKYMYFFFSPDHGLDLVLFLDGYCSECPEYSILVLRCLVHSPMTNYFSL